MTSIHHRERYFTDGGQTVVPLENDYPDGFFIEPHDHRRHQLLCARTGVVEVATPDGIWVMPPGRGMWIPAGTTHDVKILGQVLMHSLYFDPRLVADMPPRCQVLGITDFMRTLIAEAMQWSDARTDDRGAALMLLLQHELRRQPYLSLSLQFPRHAALGALCRGFVTAPDVHVTIDDWATALGTSRRSFTRLFKSETSLSFVDWRQQACILVALPRLVGGEAVTTVALDLGYDNPAAFTAMFKRILGASPRAYLGSSASVKSAPLVPVTTSSSGNL